jgi:uncharacterized protein (UPF0335 family)
MAKIGQVEGEEAPAGQGHNSGDVLNQTAQGQLKSIVERVERLEVEKAEIAEQIKEVYAEAKGNGFDVKIIRKAVRARKMDPAKRAETRAILELYAHALGDPSLADLC